MDDEGKIVMSVFGIIGIIVLIFTCTTIIGAGNVGVVFNPLSGGVQPNEMTEGLNFKAPWASVDAYNIKTQDYTMSKVAGEGAVEGDDKIRTVTSEGLYIDLDATILYRLTPAEANEMRSSVGLDGQYQGIIVRPTVRAAIREVVSRYTAMDTYSEKKLEVEAEIQNALVEQLGTRHLIIEKVLLRDVGLPPELTKAIEAKKAAEQEALKMEYILQKEELEMERKVIEARGISEANSIIAGSLTKEYLTWYWIEGLDKHDSVIYVPVGEGGIPLFKGV